MISTKSRIFAWIVLILGFLVVSTRTNAQNVVRKGNTFVQVELTDSIRKTPFTYETKDGTKYPIYISSKGKAYIIKKSKKTGKEYRQYLPKITKELNSYKNSLYG